MHVRRTRRHALQIYLRRFGLTCEGLSAGSMLPLTGADEALRLTTWDGLGTREKFKHRSTARREMLCRCSADEPSAVGHACMTRLTTYRSALPGGEIEG